MNAVTRPILRYHGGKWILSTWIIQQFPPHRVYVEPYGGAASVLLRKPRSYAEVYNDLDREIVNVFCMARDRGDELRSLLQLTPFAREEYQAAWEPSNDPLEQARRTIIRSFMGFGSAAATLQGGRGATGFRANAKRLGTTPAHDWRNFSGTGFRTYTGESDGRRNRRTLPAGDWSNYECALDAIIDRLRGVVIENRDALEVMRTHDGQATLYYVDPPYVADKRDRGSDYRFEMTDENHRQLAEVLHELKGMVILSGYESELYGELYSDWEQRRKAALADGARPRTEVLWLNPAAVRNYHLRLPL